MTDKILDRLAKLLEMSKSGNENEAALAAERAAELMVKHQLEIADVEMRLKGKEARVEVTTARIDGGDDAPPSRIENWHKNLLSSVVDLHGGRAFFRGRGKYATFSMIGPKDAVATARYMYSFLERQINRLSRAATRERGESNAWRRSYAIGMVVRVSERLRAGKRAAMATATTQALVLVDKTAIAVQAEWDKRKFRDGRSGPRKRPDAGQYGYADGDRVDIGSATGALGEGQKKLR